MEEYNAPTNQEQGSIVRERLNDLLAQTAADRAFMLELGALNSIERASHIGKLAITVAENFANDDPLEVALHVERLYASLSINIEYYDETRLLDIADIDEILVAVIDKLPSVTTPQVVENSRQAFENARIEGLNPVKRLASCFVLPETPVISDQSAAM